MDVWAFNLIGLIRYGNRRVWAKNKSDHPHSRTSSSFLEPQGPVTREGVKGTRETLLLFIPRGASLSRPLSLFLHFVRKKEGLGERGEKKGVCVVGVVCHPASPAVTTIHEKDTERSAGV